jgi:hypothetical protein
LRTTASFTHVLVKKHANNEREWVAAEKLVGGGVLGDAECRHAPILPHQAAGRLARARLGRRDDADHRPGPTAERPIRCMLAAAPFRVPLVPDGVDRDRRAGTPIRRP